MAESRQPQRAWQGQQSKKRGRPARNSGAGQPEALLKQNPAMISAEGRQVMIAEAVHYRAEQRRSEPPHELDDWVADSEWVTAPRLGRGPTLCGT